MARSCVLEWTCTYQARPAGECGTIIRSSLASALTKEIDIHWAGGVDFCLGAGGSARAGFATDQPPGAPADRWVRSGDAGLWQPGAKAARPGLTQTGPFPGLLLGRAEAPLGHSPGLPFPPAPGPTGLWGPENPGGPRSVVVGIEEGGRLSVWAGAPAGTKRVILSNGCTRCS